MKKRQGISLIVLIITIIVLIILAAAIILTLANNNPVENAKEATFKSDLSNIKDLVTLASTDILLEKEGASYVGIIPPEYEEKLEIYEGVLYYKGEPGQEEEWAKEIDVIRKEISGNGISLLIGKPELEEATIKFKVTSIGGYKVDWGDGTSNSYASDTAASHTYSTNNDKSSADGYLFEVKIAPESGDITKFEHTQETNSPLLWCEVECDTLTSCEKMLMNASKLKKFGTATETSLKNVTNMNNMFRDCINLETIPKIDTSNVESMSIMFRGCSKITEIPLLDTSKVKDMSGMFGGCISLKTIPLLNTGNVTNMHGMFNVCSNLTGIPELNTSQVVSMERMFVDCVNLEIIPKLDTSNVTNMVWMFYECSSLERIPEFDTSQVTYIGDMFSGCSSLKTIPLLDTSNIRSMSNMFSRCSSLREIPALDTSKVENMYQMFNGCSSLTSIPELNTSNVANMQSMFKDCKSLERIPKLDISRVRNIYDMSDLFYGCNNLKSINISNTNLISEQINDVFDVLPTSTNSAVIDITGNPGEAGCTRATATGKGWIVKP